MTAAAIHLAFIYAAVAVLVAIACLLAWAGERSQSIDEHTAVHRRGDQCPWCAASDERLLERERQRWRAEIAKQRREAAERRMRGAS